ncbi:MAG: hypothetical protein ACK48F_12970, partial [Chryseotalea sp.]
FIFFNFIFLYGHFLFYKRLLKENHALAIVATPKVWRIARPQPEGVGERQSKIVFNKTFLFSYLLIWV